MSCAKAWQEDVLERLEYDRDQSESGKLLIRYDDIARFKSPTVTGSKGNRWSAITVRMGESLIVLYNHNNIIPILSITYFFVALAVYTRSPAAYESLRSFKLLQLPSIRTLQHYLSANREDPGECMDRLVLEGKKLLCGNGWRGSVQVHI